MTWLALLMALAALPGASGCGGGDAGGAEEGPEDGCGVGEAIDACPVSRHPPEGHRAGVLGQVRPQPRQGHLPLRLLRRGGVRLPDEVRVGDRVAELLEPDLPGKPRDGDGLSSGGRGPGRGHVQHLRCPPRPRLPRRPRPHGPALLHELRGAQVRPDNREGGPRREEEGGPVAKHARRRCPASKSARAGKPGWSPIRRLRAGRPLGSSPGHQLSASACSRGRGALACVPSPTDSR